MVKKAEQSKWGEIGDDVIKLVANHWWKAVLIILAAGIAVTGFTCKWGKVEIHKDPIVEKKLGDGKK